MARPRKKGLEYFPLDSDFFSDKKIKILKSRYGADGVAIYIYLLCEIYRNGYYIKLDDDFEYIMSDDLNMSSDKVMQVLTFLLERSLFNDKLFQSDAVLTSTGIQRRFQLAIKERAKKNPIEVSGFWLLEESETEPFIKVTHNSSYSKNNASYSGNNPSNSKNKYTKESKVKKSRVKDSKEKKTAYFDNPDLNDVFVLYINMRNNTGPKLTDAQINILKEELDNLSKDDTEKIRITKKAFASGWKSFYPIKKKKTQANTGGYAIEHNFEQRDYDMDEIERKYLEKQFKDYEKYKEE